MVQSILFPVEMFQQELRYSFENTTQKYIGYLLIVIGLVVNQRISYFLEGSFEKTISLGLSFPTTIFRFGFLMLTDNRFPKYLLIIATLWAIIGTFAAVNFGISQDYAKLLGAIMAIIF